mmetsp:Transcript_28455/g.64743  ORF Transcript_28455/g.64743 Transcript_28455/m.64743 type:complete len:82 (+) Transcript_28455:81-326(+)
MMDGREKKERARFGDACCDDRLTYFPVCNDGRSAMTLACHQPPFFNIVSACASEESDSPLGILNLRNVHNWGGLSIDVEEV